MPTIQNMKDAIYALLNGVEGTGKVYKMRKLIKDPTDFSGAFVSDDVINTWEISNRSVPEVAEGIGSGSGIRYRSWDWVIEGWYELNYTGSEATFDDLVEAVCTAFRGENTIGGAGCESEIVQVEGKDIEGFNGGNPDQEGILCHHVIMSLQINQRL